VGLDGVQGLGGGGVALGNRWAQNKAINSYFLYSFSNKHINDSMAQTNS
jgi:hypothetical protein